MNVEYAVDGGDALVKWNFTFGCRGHRSRYAFDQWAAATELIRKAYPLVGCLMTARGSEEIAVKALRIGAPGTSPNDCSTFSWRTAQVLRPQYSIGAHSIDAPPGPTGNRIRY